MGGTGNLTFTAGTGNFTLSAANTYNGVTLISAGNLVINNNLALQNSTLNYISGSLKLATTAPVLGGLNGTLSLALNTTGGSPVSLTVGANNQDTTYSGVLSGSGASNSANLTKTGTGTLVLSGVNTYNGTTTISGGLINFAALSAFGVNTTANTTAHPVGSAPSIVLQGGGIQWAASTIIDMTRDVSISGGNSALDTFDTNAYNEQLGLIPLSGTGVVVKEGGGTLTITQNETWSGVYNGSANATFTGASTVVSNGTLQIGNGTLFGSDTNILTNVTSASGVTDPGVSGNITDNSNLAIRAARNLTIANNIGGVGNLTINGTSAGRAAITLTGVSNGNLSFVAVTPGNSPVTIQYVNGTGNNAATTVTVTGSAIKVTLGTNGTGVVNATALQVLNVLASNTTVNSLVNVQLANGTGTGVLTASNVTPLVNSSAGLTEVTLTGNNSFSGTTSIAAGSLILGSNTALNNSTLSYNVGNGNLFFGTLNNASFGGLTGNRDIALLNNSSASMNLTSGNNNSNTTYTGNLSGTGSFTKSGSGILTLTGNNTYSGGTTVKGGFINFSSLSQLGNGTTNIILNGGGLQYAVGTTVDVSSRFDTTNGLSAGTDTIDTNINNISFASVLAGAGKLGKAGTGTLFLSAHNTYTGGTIITGGLINFVNLNNFGDTSTNGITLQGGGVQWGSSTTTDISANIVALNLGNDTFDTGTNPTITLSSSLNGSGTFVKAGTGTIILTAAEVTPAVRSSTPARCNWATAQPARR
jgi:autotransporter-associated beta strand protein